MMMPRKKRRVVVITSIVMLLLIIVAIFVTLYLTTDMFKSNQTLFTKYIGKNFENFESVYKEFIKSDYDDLLNKSQYTSKTEMIVNYVENKETTSENTENVINKLKLEIDGQTDNKNIYNHQDIKLLKDNENIAEIKYIQDGKTYGIQFADIFNQYVVINNDNLKEFFKNLGLSDEQLANVPDRIEINNNLDTVLNFSEEEKEEIVEKYIKILMNNISEENFSKKNNQTIQIDGKDIKANLYTLTLTKEQLNDAYINVLEELKQDENILTKIDNIQEILYQYPIEDMDLRNSFVTKLDEIINNITQNNIGQDECKINVYENDGKTVKTEIQGVDYTVSIDLISDENYIQLYYLDNEKEKEKICSLKKSNGNTNIKLQNTVDEDIITYDISIDETIADNNCEKDLVIQYEDSKNRMEVDISQVIEIVENLQPEVSLNSKNSVNLSDVESEQAKAVMDRVVQKVSEEIVDISNKVNFEDLRKVLISIGLVKDEQIIEGTVEVTETEKNRFNSKFELLEGENLDGNTVLNLISAIKDNLIELEVVSDKELKIKLDRFNKNEELSTTLSNFIEKNKSKKYSAKVEYDETTGLVSDILLTII